MLNQQMAVEPLPTAPTLQASLVVDLRINKVSVRRRRRGEGSSDRGGAATHLAARSNGLLSVVDDGGARSARVRHCGCAEAVGWGRDERRGERGECEGALEPGRTATIESIIDDRDARCRGQEGVVGEGLMVARVESPR